MCHYQVNLKHQRISVAQIAVNEATFRFLQPYSEALVAEGFVVIHISAPTGLHDHGNIEYIPLPLTRRFQPLHILKAIYLTTRFLRMHRIHIVIASTFAGGIIGRLAGWLAGVPVVYYWPHGWLFTPHTERFKKEIIILVERFFKLFHNVTICISEEEKLIGIQKGLLRNGSNILQLLGIGIDVEQFRPDYLKMEKRRLLRTELRFEEQDFVFIFVGRLVREKGIFELVEAFEAVNKSNPRAKLLLVGDIGADEPDQSSIRQIEEKVAISAAIDSIILTGYRKDIPELLCCADAFVFPSWREGMPVSLLEAMSMELPAIATDIPGSREEILDGVTGKIVPLRDPLALEKAMIGLITDTENSKSMGKEARRRVSKYFSREANLPVFVDSLKTVRDQILVGKSVSQFKNSDWDLSEYHWPRERAGQ